SQMLHVLVLRLTVCLTPLVTASIPLGAQQDRGVDDEQRRGQVRIGEVGLQRAFKREAHGPGGHCAHQEHHGQTLVRGAHSAARHRADEAAADAPPVTPGRYCIPSGAAGLRTLSPWSRKFATPAVVERRSRTKPSVMGRSTSYSFRTTCRTSSTVGNCPAGGPSTKGSRRSRDSSFLTSE